MKQGFTFLLACILLLPAVAKAQDDAQLRQLLRNKNNLADIMQVVEGYYNSPETISRLGGNSVNRNYKHWKRWEWFMSSRLGPAGEFVNINQKMIDATGIQPSRQIRATNSSEGPLIATGNWVPLGPETTTTGIGRVDRLAFHPVNANIVYAGAAGGGLWRTTDAGTSWVNLTPDVPCLGISGIVIDHTNDNTLYILTGDGDSDISGLVEDFGYMRFSIGVLKSTDGGVRWKKMGSFPGTTSSLVGYRLVMHPTDPDILFACTSQGLFRTDDGGESWTQVDNRGRFYNFKFKPGSVLTCYAVSFDAGPGIARYFKSVDGGLSFDSPALINNQINNPTSRVELAVAESNSSVVYILCGGVPNAGGTFKGVFRSGDSGDSFILQGNSPNILGRANDGSDNASQSTYDLTIAVSNTNSATVAVGAIEVWRTLNSGINWTFRGNLHDDVHDLGFHPVDNKLWAATDGGVYTSTDNGATWTSHFEGMSVSQFYRMSVSPDDYADMIAGAQDNGVVKRESGTSFFDNIAGADGYCVGYDVANATIYYSIRNNSLTRFTGDGAVATNIVNNLRFFTNMAVHTSLANTVFLASDTFRTVTNGNVSNYIAANMPQGGWFLQTCPSNGNRIYMAGGTCPANGSGCYQATNGVLRRSDDGGNTWPVSNILSSNPGFPLSYPKITSINVNPTNSLQVWVTMGGYTDNVKVYYSADGGANWVNRTGSLPNLPVNCIALDNSNNAYIGTDNGVYYRGTGMSDWVPFYNNLPYVPVTDIVISQAQSRLRISTFGRGIWSSETYSPCVPDLALGGVLEGQEFHEASNNITSTSALLTSNGTKVQMRGGNQVLLQDGFTARETTEFRAMIGPCGTGGVAGFHFETLDSGTLIQPQKYLAPQGGRKALVHVASQSATEVRLNLDIKGEGVIEIVLADASGAVLRRETVQPASAKAGLLSFATGGLAPGTYYLHVLLDKRWEHMQELVLQN